ncbi:hypothetical protein D3C80_1416180 [compost metagenome]
MQWQRLLVIFQQHHGLAGNHAGFRTVQTAFGIGILRVGTNRAKVVIRIFKQAHIIFGVQHVTAGPVDLAFSNQTFLHQPRQVLVVILVAHAHIDAGGDRQTHRITRILSHAMLNQLFTRAVIADGDAFEAPLVTQQIFQQPWVGRRRYAVD